MSEQTIGQVLEHLTAKEKAILCHCLNTTGTMGYKVHQGLLPFIRLDVSLAALTGFQTWNHLNTRPVQTLVSKLNRLFCVDGSATFTMYLDDKKVARRFGAHPERGHNIPFVGKKRVTCGVKWSLPHKDYIPDENVMVQPHLTLNCLQKGIWRIKCDAKYREQVQNFLVDYCM